MKKNLKIRGLIIIAILTFIVAGVCITKFNWHKNIVFNQNNLSFIGILKAKDGKVLGDMYGIRVTDNVFSSIEIGKEIDGKKVVIYKINDKGYFNTEGKDGGVVNTSFYGFELVAIKDDYFIVHLLSEGGENVSDDLTVKWNYQKEVFEISRVPLQEL